MFSFDCSSNNLPIDRRPSTVSLFDDDRSKATILRELSHPNIVRIYNFYEEEPEYFFIVLEFMEGGELLQRIKQKVKTVRTLLL